MCWALALAVLGLMGGLFFLFADLADQGMIPRTHYDGMVDLWHANRLEVEALEVLVALDSYRLNPTASAAAEVGLRFDILWSRIMLWPGHRETNHDFKAFLSAWDPHIQQLDTLGPGKLINLTEDLRRLIAAATGLTSRMSQSLQNYTWSFEARYAQRLDLGIWALGGIAVGSGVLTVLSLVNLRSLWALSRSLEGQVQQRTAALRAEIAERTRTQRDLAAEENRLRMILNATGEGVCGLDEGGRCTFCNPAGLALLGYNREADLLGQPLAMALAAPPRFLQAPDLRRGLRHLLRWAPQGNTTLRRRDGQVFPATYTLGYLGQGAVAVFADDSERQQREAERLQAQKLETLGHLSGGVAHDFNNLLTVILGNLQLLQEALKARSYLDGGERALVNEALAAADAGANLTQRLLTFARKRPLYPRPVALQAFLPRVLPLAKRLLPKGVTLTVTETLPAVTVRVDPQQLENALLNLAINAGQASVAGGTVELIVQTLVNRSAIEVVGGTLAPGRYAALSVADRGEGMDPETQRRACEPFFTTKSQGTGLGLSTVHGFVVQSKGGLALDSHRGRGTRVTLYLPLVAVAATEEQIPGGVIP